MDIVAKMVKDCDDTLFDVSRTKDFDRICGIVRLGILRQRDFGDPEDDVLVKKLSAISDEEIKTCQQVVRGVLSELYNAEDLSVRLGNYTIHLLMICLSNFAREGVASSVMEQHMRQGAAAAETRAQSGYMTDLLGQYFGKSKSKDGNE